MVCRVLSRPRTNVLNVIVILFHLTFDWFTTFTPELRLPSLAILSYESGEGRPRGRGGVVNEHFGSRHQGPRRLRVPSPPRPPPELEAEQVGGRLGVASNFGVNLHESVC